MIKKKCEDCDFLKFDPLTGVFRREYFKMIFHQKFDELSENYILCVLDIDFFKRFNDDYGHITGDFVLKKFSDNISGSLYDDEFAGRFGGEEFVAVLKNNRERIADFFYEVSKGCKDLEYENRKIPDITFSMGISVICRSFLFVFKTADQALYFCKGNGRNQYVFFEDLVQNQLMIKKKEIHLKKRTKMCFLILGFDGIYQDNFIYGRKYFLKRLEDFKNYTEKLLNPLECYIYNENSVCLVCSALSENELNAKIKILKKRYVNIFGIINRYPGVTKFRHLFKDTYYAYLCHTLYSDNQGIVEFSIKTQRIISVYFLRKGNYDLAYEFARRAYLHDRENEAGFLNVCAIGIKKELFKRSLILLENNQKYNNTLSYYISLSNIYFKLGEFQKAKTMILEGIKKFPDSDILRNNLQEIQCI